jgi:signal peptide peptidase SppA
MRRQEFDTMTLVALRQTETLEKIAAEMDKPLPETMMTRRGERLQNTRYVEIRDSVAVIDVNGRLSKRMGFFAEICEGGTSTEILLKDFQTVLDNPAVKSIVFNIDSPGGEAFGINEFANHIFNARGKKPMTAYVGGLGCSGAYWIASACDEVVCDKSAFLGSIGVVSVAIDDTQAYKMLGFDKRVVTSSNAPKKRLDLNTDEGMAEFQAELDAMENVFISSVARNRKVKREQVINDFNQGGVLVGADAVKAKMADRVGSLEQVIREQVRGNKNPANAKTAEHKGEINMSFKDKFRELAAAAGFTVQETAAETVEETLETSEMSDAETVRLKAEVQAANSRAERAEAEKAALLKAQAAAKETAITEKARAYVSKELAESRLLPAEKESFEASYLQALKDDEAAPLPVGSRAALLETSQAKRTPHLFASEQIAPDATARVLHGDQSASAEDRADELLRQTPLGRSALKIVKDNAAK